MRTILRALKPTEARMVCTIHNQNHRGRNACNIDTDEFHPIWHHSGHTQVPLYKVTCTECPSLVVAVTGHRPQRIPRYNFERLVDLAAAAIRHYCADRVWTGMALGWDMAIAEACNRYDIPFVAAIPSRTQYVKWSMPEQDRYHNLLEKAAHTHVITGEHSYREACFARNRLMVDEGEFVIALFDGVNHGGTFHAVKYAKREGKPIKNMYRSWEEGMKC